MYVFILSNKFYENIATLFSLLLHFICFCGQFFSPALSLNCGDCILVNWEKEFVIYDKGQNYATRDSGASSLSCPGGTRPPGVIKPVACICHEFPPLNCVLEAPGSRFFQDSGDSHPLPVGPLPPLCRLCWSGCVFLAGAPAMLLLLLE